MSPDEIAAYVCYVAEESSPIDRPSQKTRPTTSGLSLLGYILIAVLIIAGLLALLAFGLALLG